jgi:hypothetical protein
MTLTTRSLIQEIDRGEIALPEFQRDYKWPDDFIVELLRSIARGWPIGTFLVLEQTGKGRLLSRQIAGAPKPKVVPHRLILDGQQRATALYQALTGKGKRKTTFYVDMHELRREDKVTDETIEVLPDKSFEKEFGRGIDENAAAGVIRMQDLITSSTFSTWLNHVGASASESKVFADLKDAHLANFTDYALKVVPVSAELPMEAIAKIFERTNRSVLQLDAFDLMVAILFPHKHFNLRKKWEAAKDSMPVLVDYDIAGIEILKVIALREHLKQREEVGAEKRDKYSVKGVRQSDVLALDPKLVIKEWKKAVTAYAHALEFVRDECGAIRKRIIPQPTMLLPIADSLYGRKSFSPAARKKVGRWFWAVSFQRLYAAGANTRAVVDARALRDWLGHSRSTPEEVEAFSIDPDAFAEIDDGNDILTAASICLLNTLGARDWSKESAKGGGGRRLSQTPISTDLGVHHIFPRQYLKTRKRRAKAAVEVPANQVLIDAGLNSSIRNEPPGAVLKNTKVITSALKTHLADESSMRNDNYDAFIKLRAQKLAQAARKAVHPPR